MATDLNTGSSMPNHISRIRDSLSKRFGETLTVDEDLAGLDELARLAGRRVQRRTTERAVDPELLRLLCACALSAPSKSDLQQADIVIVNKADQAVIADLIPDQPFIRTAPAFLGFRANDGGCRKSRKCAASRFRTIISIS